MASKGLKIEKKLNFGLSNRLGGDSECTHKFHRGKRNMNGPLRE